MDKGLWFAVLGGNMLLRGINDKLKEFGYKVVVVDWNDDPVVKGDLHLQIDVKDASKVIDALKRLNVKIDGAVTCIDLAVPTVNAINSWLGLNVMPEKFNGVLTKNEMRDCWEKAGFFNRISKSDDQMSLSEIYDLSQKMAIVIKPDIAASSRGISIMEKGQSLNSIEVALKKAKEASFDGKCLIEEFVSGEEFTVDMLGDSYGNVCVYGSSIAYQSKNAHNNHVGIKYHWNSKKYPDEVWNRIAEFGQKCYKAIGLHTSFGHLEILMKEDGSFTPIEMGARSSGFIASHLVSAASGHDFLKDYIKVLHGGKVKSGHYLNGSTSSMWFGYDIPKNSRSVKVSNLEKYLDSRIEVLYSKRDGLVAGQDFGEMINDNDRDKCGYEIIVGPKDVLTIDNVEAAENKFLDEFLGRK